MRNQARNIVFKSAWQVEITCTIYSCILEVAVFSRLPVVFNFLLWSQFYNINSRSSQKDDRFWHIFIHTYAILSCVCVLNTATPLDCEVSLWSSWGLCLGPCSRGGVRHRTRYILLRPANSGTPCPELEEQAECVPHSCMKLQ